MFPTLKHYFQALSLPLQQGGFLVLLLPGFDLILIAEVLSPLCPGILSVPGGDLGIQGLGRKLCYLVMQPGRIGTSILSGVTSRARLRWEGLGQ